MFLHGKIFTFFLLHNLKIQVMCIKTFIVFALQLAKHTFKMTLIHFYKIFLNNFIFLREKHPENVTKFVLQALRFCYALFIPIVPNLTSLFYS